MIAKVRKYRFQIIFSFMLLLLAYVFVKQKQSENELMIQRIENMKNTVPPSIYNNIRKLKEKLISLESENNARTQELLTLRRKLKDRFSENITDGNLLSLPSVYNYLPHLLGHKDALTPILHASNRKRNKRPTLAFGIPTVRRTKSSYLLNTLGSLIFGLTAADKDDVLIIVFIGEKNSEYVTEIHTKIANKFPNELRSGLLVVIAPPPNFYPDLDNLPVTFGDPKSRVKWRAKQNLDYAFLMMYAQSRAMFYVQMEDDLIATPSYASTMKAFALQQQSNVWFMIEFSSLGFIGKLFRTSDLSILVEFFLMFYKEKPNDWLLDHVLWVRVCNPEKDSRHCKKQKARLRIRFKPSLFQHVGKVSSLEGKKQNLIDKDFRKEALFQAHLNPKAVVLTTFEEYQEFSAHRGYLGHTFFWALTPVKDYVVRILFVEPELLNTFLFRSGNVEHPGDILTNSTVEVLTKNELDTLKKNHVHIDKKFTKAGYSKEHYTVVGSFDTKGLAKGVIPTNLGPIVELRIRVLGNVTENWVLISEFYITKTKK